MTFRFTFKTFETSETKKKNNKHKIYIEMSDGSEEMSEASKVKLLKRKYKQAVDAGSDKKEVKKPPMPTYGKYNILKILKENHCLIADEIQLSNAFPRNKRYNLDDIKNFVNKSAQKSQSIINKNNKSIEFKRSNELVSSIEERSAFADRSLDIPLTLKTITDVFTYEDEEVDVRMLYQTLTNLALGFPTSQLDNATNNFLYGVYKEFLDQVNTPQFKEDVRKYQNFFNNREMSSESIDIKHPTQDSDMHLVVKSALNSTSVNPLKVPYSFLHKPKDTSIHQD